MICKRNIFLLFVQEFNLFLFSKDSEEFRNRMMKRHKWAEEQFDSMHKIFMEEFERLPGDNLIQIRNL